jgi:hypothetical protein
LQIIKTLQIAGFSFRGIAWQFHVTLTSRVGFVMPSHEGDVQHLAIEGSELVYSCLQLRTRLTQEGLGVE